MEEIIFRVIYDNCKENKELQEGWGFSALIEIADRKILFDTGNDRNAFFFNIEKMGIDLKQITDVVFSHKHDDHIAGCIEISGKLRANCKVFLPKGFPHEIVSKHLQIKKISDFQEIGKNIFCMVLKGGLFLYEQILILQTKKGLVIITGCAHPGIIHIIEEAQTKLKTPVYFVMGGFHLFRKKSCFINEIVRTFRSLSVKQVAPCHCSGEATLNKFKEIYCHDFYSIGTGSVLKIS